MENECIFVSSRGILKSTNIHTVQFSSSNPLILLDDYKNITKGSIVYVCNSAIKNFIQTVLPTLKDTFVLVSGDSDVSVPDDILSITEFNSFLEDPRLQHWFCQNLVVPTNSIHRKLSHLPIGLDYHTISSPGNQHPWGLHELPTVQEKQLLEQLEKNKTLQQKVFLAYSNFHHAIWGIGQRGDRQEAVNKIPKDCVYYEPNFTSRDVAWAHQSQFHYVLSPKGGGYDCHRTWEALCLGCIPIVKSSNLDPLYTNLPVLIVKDWSDISQTLLKETYETFSKTRFNMRTLYLSHWVARFKEESAKC